MFKYPPRFWPLLLSISKKDASKGSIPNVDTEIGIMRCCGESWSSCTSSLVESEANGSGNPVVGQPLEVGVVYSLSLSEAGIS